MMRTWARHSSKEGRKDSLQVLGTLKRAMAIGRHRVTWVCLRLFSLEMRLKPLWTPRVCREGNGHVALAGGDAVPSAPAPMSTVGKSAAHLTAAPRLFRQATESAITLSSSVFPIDSSKIFYLSLNFTILPLSTDFFLCGLYVCF